jgi:hypothetical protein
MRNRFPGECYRCKAWVPAGEGHFERIGGGWRVQHAACAIEFRGTIDPVRDEMSKRRTEWLETQTGIRGQRARKRLREREALSAHQSQDQQQ